MNNLKQAMEVVEVFIGIRPKDENPPDWNDVEGAIRVVLEACREIPKLKENLDSACGTLDYSVEKLEKVRAQRDEAVKKLANLKATILEKAPKDSIYDDHIAKIFNSTNAIWRKLINECLEGV